MHSAQPSALDAPSDLALRDPEGQQLATRDSSVLPFEQWAEFHTHTVRKPAQGAFRPPSDSVAAVREHDGFAYRETLCAVS